MSSPLPPRRASRIRSRRTSRVASTVRALAAAAVAAVSLLVTTCRVDTLTSVPPPLGQLSVTPSDVFDTVAVGSMRQRAASLDVTNAGQGTLVWSAQRKLGAAWLTLAQTSGTAPATLGLTFNPAGLALGVYRDTILIAADNATGSPALVPVEFHVNPCTQNPFTLDFQLVDSLRTSDCAAPHRSGSFARLYSFSAAAGDSISATVSTSVFTPALVLDSATASGSPPLARNSACAAAPAPCLRYQAIPKAGTYVLEATSASAGATGTFTLSVSRPHPPLAPDSLNQTTDSVAVIPVGGAITQAQVVVRGVLHDPDAGDTLHLEVEVQPLGTPFTNVASAASARVPNGSRAYVLVTGLADNTSFHWQARTLDQTGRASAWSSFGGNAETAADFSVAVPLPPAVPSALGQFHSDATTAIPVGASTSEATVVFKAALSSPDPGDQLRLDVEVEPLGTAFTNTPTASSAPVANGSTAAATVTGLKDATSYHWQARTVAQSNLASAWVSYGNNAETAADFTVALAPAHLVFTTQPSTTTAGVAITPAVQVTAEDAFGQPVTSFTAAVTIAIGTNAGGGTLSGTTTVDAVNGVATFSSLSIDKAAAGYTLQATSSTLTATSATFAVAPAAASALVFTVQPTTTNAGSPISPPVQVTARDAFGNTATSFAGSVTVAIGTNPGGGTLSGTLTVAAASGVASFNSLNIDKTGTGYTLTAASSGLTAATSGAFTIIPAASTKLVFTVQPTNTTAGAAISPAVQVTAEDNLGNTVTGFTGSVTVAIGTNSGGATLSGTTTKAAVAGVVSFSDLSLDKVGTGYTLTASASGAATGTSGGFTITPGVATALVFSVQPASAIAGVAIAPAVQVTAQDAKGNVATGFTGSVTLAIGTNPGNGTLAGTTTASAVSGVASFSTLSINKTGTGYTLAASGSGLAGATSTGFNITPAQASQLAFTAQPTTAQAGSAIAPAVQVTARDAFGNTATGFSASVTVAIGTNPGGGTLSGTLTSTAVAGVATFGNLSIDKTGTGYTLTASATSLTGVTSTAFNITAATGTKLVFTVEPVPPPSADTAGRPITPALQVTAEDNLGNTVTNFTGTVTVAIATNPSGGVLSGTAQVSAVAGVATFSTLSIDKVGTGYTLTASAPPATGFATATSSAFNITPGFATQLVFSVQPTSATAGSAISPAVQVTALDAKGNTASGFAGTVTVAIGTNAAGGTLSGTTSVAAAAGVAMFGSLSINRSGTGYTLSASASGLTGGTSTAFAINPGSVSQLAFLVQPTSTAAASTITPAIQVAGEDALGNTVPSFTGTVTLAIGTNPGSGTLAGTASVAAVNGVATFSTLSINKSGAGYTLAASSGVLAGATSAAFPITPSAATQLVFSVQPTSTTAGAAITPSVQVTAQDAQGNVATGFTGNVTVAIGTNPGTGTLAGTTTVAAVSGVASFSGLNVNKSGTGYTLTAAATGLATGTSGAFTITPGPASQLVFSVQPITTTAGTAIAPAVQVTAQDAQGNVATAFTSTVTVAIGTNPGGGTLAGTASVAAVNGVATFSTLSINKTGSGYTLTAVATGVTGATSGAFAITANSASQLVFTVQPTNATAGTAITPALQVTAEDNLGNTVTSFTNTVTVAIGTNPGSGTLAGTTTVAAASGVATFSTLSINKSGTGYTLTAGATGLSGSTSTTFNITPAAATQLVFTVQPTTTTAAAAITPAVQVTAEDAQGNTVTGFTGTVTVAIGTNPGSGTLAGTTTVAAVSGVATFSTLSINKSGTGYTLGATATGLTGTSSAFSINPGVATRLAFSVQPSTATAGSVITPAVQVTAQDAQGNVATAFTGSVTVAIGTNPGSGTLSGTTTVSAPSAVASFGTLSIDKAGVGYTLTATAAGLTAAASTAFTVSAAAANKLVFTVQPTTTTAGAAITPAVQVTAQDAQGNTVTGFTGSVTIAIGTNPGSGTLAGTATVAAASGVATFPGLSINKAGAGYTLTASGTSLTTGTSSAFAINPGTAATLVFAVQPTTTTATAAITPAVQVTAQDAQGNTATGFTSTVTVAIGTNPSGGTLSGTASVAAVSGVATFSTLSINKSGAGYTLTATAAGPSSATSTAFTITPGTATALVFSVQPTNTTAGAAIAPAVQVTAQDAQGNVATGFGGAVTVAIATNPSGGTLSGTASVAAVSGVATFSTVSINKTGLGYTLTATATGPTGATSTPFNITPGGAAALVFSVQPTNTTAGAAITPAVQVTAQDAQGNVATAFSGTVTVAIAANPGAGTLSGSTSVAAVNGVATLSTLSINRSGTGYTLTATAAGPSGATSGAFTITPGSATALVFSVQPTLTAAGAAIAPAVQVSAQDAQGNVATAFGGTVTVAIGTNPSAGTLSGTASVAAVNGVATFSTLSINRTGSGYTLTATATGPTAATSAAFNITPGTAAALVFTVQPTNATAGSAITPAVQVTARDAQGNTATGFSGSVTVAIGTNPGSGALSGTTTVAAASGVATFSTLSINKTGAGYTLAASATGPTGATSAAFNVRPGAATQSLFTVQPSNTTAGAAITPAVQVTAADASGNTDTSFVGNVNVTISTNPASGTLGGTTTVAAVHGVATFSTLSINKSGAGYTLLAASSGLISSTSGAFTISPATASQLVFTVQPTSATAGVAIAPAVQVTAQDAQGNTATSFTGSVTVAIGTNPGTGTLSGTATVAAVSGVASFSGLSINKTGAGYTLTASATGPSGATSAPFTINPGPVSQLGFLVQPTTTTAASAITPAIQVAGQDGLGNTVPSFTGTVTVAIGTNPGAGTLAGTASVAAVNGVATFSTLSINKSGTGYTLTAAATGLGGATSTAFAITPGTAKALAFSVQPTNTTAGAAITPAVQVTAQDAQGNVATGFSGTVTAAIGTNPGGGTLAGTASVAAVNGVATFSTLSINKTGSGYTLTAAASGVTGATSGAFAITASSASQLVFTVQPTSTTAGAAITPAVQVTAEDAQGNTVTGFTGNVTIAIATNPGSGTLAGTTTVAAVSGIASFSGLNVNKSGTGYTLTATATGVATGTSSAFNITPGAASQLVFSVQPTTTTAGTAIAPAVQVTAQDAQGNVASAFTGTVTVAIGTNPGGGTLAGTASVAAVNGVATFSTLSINKTGSGYTLTAAASSVTGATSGAFAITASSASQLVFTVQPATTTAAVTITPAVQVTAEDAQGNTVTGFTGSVTVAIGTNPGSGTLAGTTTIAAVSGVATFSTLSINKSGTGYTLSATASGVPTGTSSPFTITPGTATALVFSVQPSSATAGSVITPAVQVTAQDAQGNVATSFTGSVTVAIGTNPGGGILSGTAAQAAVAGVASFGTLSIDKAGVGYTLTGAATGLTSATSTAFTVSAAAANKLVFTVQPTTTTAGAVITPAVQVTAQDAQGNTVTGFTGNVTVAIGTNPGSGTLAGTTTVAAVSGVATFSTLSINRSGAGYTLTASGTSLTTGTSGAFTINPGTAAALVFSVQPTSAIAGAVITPAVQVTAQDAQGNTATGFTGSVTVAIGTNPGSGTLSGTTVVAAASGVASFSTLAINKSGIGYTLSAAATGPTGATSTAFTITSGTAATLVFSVQPTSTTAGAPITPAVQVTAQDAQGNVATGFSGAVTVAIGTNPSAGTLSGTASVAAVNGVASFPGLSVNKSGAGYTLTATATGPGSGTSAAFAITAGGVSASQSTVVAAPTTITASAGASQSTITVTALDANGNPISGATVVLAVTGTGNTLTQPAAATNASGIATGTLSSTVAEAKTVSATIGGTAVSATAAVTVSPASASQLAFTVGPTTTTAASPITPAVQATARDPFGNVATSFTGSVTIAIGTNPGGGTLAGTTTVTAVGGVAAFSTLSINKSGAGYTLTAAATGLTGATSAAFTVTPSTATQLVFTVQPTSATAGVAIAPAVQVTARDAQGNTATGFTGAVTVAIGTNPGSDTLSGTKTVAAAAGVATFSNVSIDASGAGYTLAASATGLTGAISAGFNIRPGKATQVAFTVQPSTTTAGAAFTPAVQVTAQDASGNTDTSFASSVTVTIGTNPGGGTLAGTTTVTAVHGVATFGALSINKTGVGYTLLAVSSGLISSTSGAFTINPGVASQLVFSTEPASTTAGGTLAAVQVTTEDAQGNTATGFTGTVTVAIGTNPGSGTLSGTTAVAATSGVATFSTLSINKSGVGYTLTATASGTSGTTSTAFTITSAAATQLVFTVQPTSTTAGGAITPAVQVTAEDAQNNPVTSFTGNVTVAIGTNPGSGTLAGTATVAAVSGVATFSTLSINKVGTGYTLTAAGTSLTTGTSGAFNVTAGAASALVFSVQPTSTTAGTAITPAVQVTAQDAQGNIATGFSGTVTVAIGTNPSAGTLSGTTAVAAVGGVASFATLSINRSGAGYTLTATATGPTSVTSTGFTINPGAATALVFSVQPTTTTAGAVLAPAVQVTAQDAQGNTATGFSGTVSVAIGTNPGSGTLSGTTSVAAASGVATFSTLSINKSGTGYTLTSAAGGVAGATSAPFNITANAATQLVFSVGPTSATAGTAIAPAVQVSAEDAQGNVATSFTGSVTVVIGTNPSGGTLAGTTTVTAVAGVATFSTLSINKAGAGYTLAASSGVLTGATSAAFTITSGSATQLVFSVQPTATTAGSAITPAVQVTAQDAQGNTATGFTGNVTVAIGTNAGGGTLAGTATVAAVGGVATFSTLSINKSGTGYTLTAGAAGTTGATSAGFTINPGAVSQLVFTVQPTSTVAGSAITPAVQVAGEDALGNTVPSFTTNVTVAIGTNPSSGTLSGTTTVAAVSGVATFSTLNINKSGSGYTLTAAASGLTGATSSAFAITASSATQLVFTVQPTPTAAGAAITPAVQLTALDAQGNTATGFTGNVTVAIGTNAGGGTLGGTTTVAAASGVATFSTLNINKSGSGYTLTAAANGLTGATSTAFAITATGATQLVFTVQPSTTTAGAAIAPAVQVTAQDAQGNVATAFTGSVTVAIGTNPGSGTLAGTTTVTAVSGVAGFSTLSINKSGSGYTLAASATGLGGATSAAFTINPGTATALLFSVQPTNATAGSVITPAVQVTAQDAQGNVATAFTGTVTVAIGTNPGGGTLTGTTAQAAVAGVASFGTLSIDKSGVGYTLTAAATGLTGVTSTGFTVSAAAANKLVFTTQPAASTSAGATLATVAVTAQDASGNTVTSFTGNITVAIGTNPGSGTLAGTTTVAAVSGVASFSTLSVNKTGTGYTLTASASGLTTATSSAFTITAGAATQLLFSVQPTATTAGAAITPAVQVTAEDAQGNTATGFTGNISLAIGTNPGGGTLAGTATVAAVSGVASFSGLSINKSGTGYTLSATASTLSAATSAAFTITSGSAAALVFSVQPTTTTAGAAVTPAVQVTAQDAQGNVATGFSGTVTVAIGTNPSGGTLSGTASVAAASGVASFAGLSINKAGAGYTLTASASGPSGATSAAFTINPGPASALIFSVEPTNTTAGSVITPAVQVTAQDAQGNVATAFTGSVTVAIGTNPSAGSLSGTTSVTPVSGVATFSGLSINRSGAGYTLTASASGPSSVTSTAFTITPGAASALVFSVQPANTTAGAAITPAVQVTAQDAQGNTATGFTGTVTVAIGTNPSSGTLSGTTAVAAVSGVATFSTLTIDKSGSGYTLTAATTSLTGATSGAFVITPGAAATLVFTGQPTNVTAGSAIAPAVQVTARDAHGNTATGFTGTVTVAIGTNPSGGTLSGTTTLAAASGVATFSTLSINKSGAGYTLTAAATGPSGATSSGFDVRPGAATQVTFTVQPTTTTAGATITPAVQVTAQDASGNTDTSFTGSVAVAIGTNAGGGTLAGTTTVMAAHGIATFSTLSINKSGVGYTLLAASSGLISNTSSAFTITAATASQLVFSTQPTNATAGATITPAVVVTAEDPFGNTATGFTGTVTVAIGTNPGSGTLSGTTSVGSVSGVATFSTVSINKTGAGYTLTAAASGTTGATSTAFTISPSAATQLVFTVQPTSTTAGAVITPAVQVTAEDAQGNTATGFSGTVTVAIGTNAGGGTLAGTTTVAAASGVATFSTLSINKTGTGYTLAAAATGLSTATSTGFTITPGAASALAFSVQPSTTPAGTAITPAVQVTALDAQGNIATGFSANVTVAIGTNPGGGALAGSVTVAAAGGVATFSSLSINKSGAGYTLTAAATSLTGATSAAFTITPGVATTLGFSVQPTNTGAGAVITPAVQVTAQDAQGNTATGFTGTVTLAIGTNPGSGTLSGTTSVAAVSGIATFSSLSINKSGAGYTLTAAATSLTGAMSSGFTITPGAATQLVFTVQPTSTTAGGAIAPAVQVTAEDALGNTATGFSGNVTVAIGTNAGGGALAGATTIAAASGVATFSSLSINKTGSGYTLTAAATSLTAATSTPFNITPGAASALVFSVQPTSSTAGATITPAVQVTAQDAQGNTATGFSGTVTLAIGANPGSGTLAGTTAVAAVSGVATFATLSINKSGTGYTLTAAATGPSGATSTPFNVTPGTAAALIFSVQPSTATAGAAITPAVQVTAQDAQGNTATGFSGNVTVAIGTNPSAGTLAGTTTVAAVSGVASFSTLSINKSGVGYTLTAAATGPTSATSTAFTINPGTATALIFSVEPSTATAGTAIAPPVQVTAQDAQGNTATAFSGNVTVAIGTNPSAGTLSGTTTVAAVGGVASFSTLSIDKSGAGYTLTAAATGPSSATSTAFTINPGTAATLIFSVQPTTTTAGSVITPAVQVTAQDAQGNTATGFSSNVTVAIGTNAGGGTLSGTATVAAASGVATFSTLSLNRSGVGYTLTAAATGPSAATSAAFTINPGTAATLIFSVQPTATTAGATIAPSVQVTAQDAQGNTATGFGGTVTVAIGTNPSAGTLSGASSVAAASGVASFSTLSIDKSGVGYTLTAAAPSLTGATSAAFTINPGTAAVLVFSVQPTTTPSATAITPAVQVTAQDAHGNTATGFSGSITVAIGTNPGSGTLSGTTSVAAVSGVAVFSSLSIDKSGVGYTLTASATGSSSATSSAFTINPGPATALAFTVQPTNTTAGVAIAPAVQVTAEDAQGNTVTSFTGTVTVAIGTNPGGGTLSGTTSVAAVSGVASFSTLSIDKSGAGYTLTAAATSLTGATSAGFTISAAAASSMVINAGNLQTATAGSAVPIPPSVLVTDQFGNAVPGVAVSFAVVLGGGTVNPTTPVTTDTTGVAAVVSWTLGLGANTLNATATIGGTPTTVTFTATGL